jgi:ABC transport system ATP-binding/permease protein
MSIQNVILVYRKEGTVWQRRPLPPGTYSIGRSVQADIQFDASNLSRLHIEVTVDENGVQVVDLHSSNGSFLNGERLTPHQAYQIKAGDLLRIGSFEMTFEWDHSEQPKEEPFIELPTSFRAPEPLERTLLDEEDSQPGGFVLRYTTPEGEAVEKPLEPGQYVIGRADTCDIPLRISKASRLHARLEVSDLGCTLEDLGSSNGTFYQGNRLEPHNKVLLAAGSVFTIGGCDFTVVVQGVGAPADEVDATRVDEIPKFARQETPEPATQIDGAGGEGPTEIEGGFGISDERTSLDAQQPMAPVGELNKGVLLKFRRERGEWDRVTMLPGEYVLGRSAEADISLPDEEISRRHLQLSIDAQAGCYVMDLGSANGTQLNGMPLQPRNRMPLAEGGLVKLGSYEIQLAPLTSESMTQIQIGKTEIGETVVGATQVMPAVSVPILRWREGSGPWSEFQLVTGEQILGRSSEAQLRVPSNTISRQHARLFVQGQQVWLTDLNSKNGIVINGQKLTSNQNVALPSGTRFMVDDFVFELVVGTAAAAGDMSMTAFEGSVGPCILEPGKLNLLLNLPAEVSGADQTMIGAELGIDMALLGAQQAQAPINLAGHERVTIGRADDNMIAFKHPLVSRYHAVIERMGTRTRITDLHSANGVYINEQVVEGQGWLKPGDVIKIGPFVIAFTGNELRPSTAQSYAIDAVGLQKWVTKDLNLLKNISLSVGQNEFVALVGMSGAGKSTLMDAINGFRPATHGRVYVNGTDLYQNYAAFRDDIGNVPQKDIVHTELTAEQALDYAAQLRMPPDSSAAERKHAVAETLADLGLTFRKDVLISRLSGGQLKRVSIGVELLTKPRLFFLDEPTSGLDPGTEYEMMKLLRRLADQGRTIMIITHATKNVMFCDKAIIIAKGGNMAFYGPPEDALRYFDQFRSDRERLEKDMEFDDIYRILEDPAKGKPEQWRERYLQSEYARYTQPQNALQQAAPIDKSARKRGGKRISGLRQFFILSSRYLRCMFQDKASLILMLSLAPILGLMNFIWGSKLFDPVQGNAAKTMGVWFAMAIMGILVGYMGSIQELVKEQDIYKRERAVGLKILPYIMSKVWVGAALAFYQAFFILVFTVILARPAISNIFGYLVLYVTLWLVIFCSFILGLLISAISNNPNTAQLIMIATFVPQILLAGVLQPLHLIVGGDLMSPIVVARWGFENFVNATGMGDPLVDDVCWSGSTKEERSNLTSEEKELLCTCMGPQLFRNCGTIPGILSPDMYDEEAQVMLAMPQPEQPEEPDRLPTPTRRNTPTLLPSPTFLPSPTYLPTPTPWMTPTSKPIRVHVNPEQCDDGEGGGWTQEREDCMNQLAANEVYYQKQEAAEQMEEYQVTREAQFEVYREDTENQFNDYRQDVEGQFEGYKEDVGGQIDETIDEDVILMEEYADENLDVFNLYKDQMEEYSDELSYYERTRQKAISSAEAVLGMLWDDYGRAFRGGSIARMFYISLITLVEFILLLIFMKRKDTI